MKEFISDVENFELVWSGEQTYQVRISEQLPLWSVILLKEVDRRGKPTGREIAANVTHVTEQGAYGVSDEIAMFGIKVYQRIDPAAENPKAPKV